MPQHAAAGLTWLHQQAEMSRLQADLQCLAKLAKVIGDSHQFLREPHVCRQHLILANVPHMSHDH